MKRAKIMLMAITVFGVVGGALAFKAKSFSVHQFYSLSSSGVGCVITTNLPFTTVGVTTTTIPYSSSFNAAATTCQAGVRATE